MRGRVYVSSTRLVVRVRALPGFMRSVEAVQRDLRRMDGFLGGALLVEPRLAFWTVSAWDGPKAMRAFRDGGAHARVMPLLASVGAEAAYAGWWQDEATLPSWQEIHRRFLTDATFTNLPRPNRRHRERRIAPPRFGLPRPLPAAAAAATSVAVATAEPGLTSSSAAHASAGPHVAQTSS